MIVVGDHEKMKKKSNILEMVNCTTKQWEMWDSMILAEYIWGYFHLVVFNVIWGHLVHLQCLKKNDFLNDTASIVMVLLSVKLFIVFSCHSPDKPEVTSWDIETSTFNLKKIIEI